MSQTSLETWVVGKSLEHRIPGVAISVSSKDGPVFEGAWGVHTRPATWTDKPKPLEANNLFALSSQSKVMTATAILQLVDKGAIHPRTGRALSLDDQITDLLPQLDHTELRGVTLRDALSHNTTYHGQHVVNGHLLNGEWLDGTTPFPAIDGDKKYAFPLNSFVKNKQPGYSNAVYGHLGRVVADVAGTTYGEHVRQEIIHKHGLGEIYPSLADVPADQRSRIPTGYHWDVAAPHVDTKPLVSGGGGFATAPAWSAFINKLATGQILSKQSTDEMFKVHTNFEDGTQCGLGVFCHTAGNGEKLWGPDGSGPGYRSQTLHNFESGQTYAIMQTRNDFYPKFDLPERVRTDPAFNGEMPRSLDCLNFIDEVIRHLGSDSAPAISKYGILDSAATTQTISGTPAAPDRPNKPSAAPAPLRNRR